VSRVKLQKIQFSTSSSCLPPEQYKILIKTYSGEDNKEEQTTDKSNVMMYNSLTLHIGING
jgi:hypothetical protein